MRILLFLFTLILLLPMQASANEYIMVFGGRYPPFYWMGKVDGSEKTGRGMFIDFLDAFEEEHPDMHIRRICLPRKRMDEWLIDGRADAFSLNAEMFVSPEHKKHMVFTEPLWRSGDHLMVPVDSDIQDSSLESIKGKLIGLIHGNKYGHLDKAAEDGLIKTSRAVSMRMLLEMLDRGRLDAVVINRHTVHHYVSLLDFAETDYRLVNPPLFEFDLAVAVHRDHQELLQSLNDFIRQSRADGLLERLERKWFSEKYIQEERLPSFQKTAAHTP